MENVLDAAKTESIKSFQSTIRKTENGLSQMTQKGASTTLIKKRLNAFHVGLAMLENIWNQKPHNYVHEDHADARQTLIDLLPTILQTYEKTKAGSPQRTLLERRIKAFELAIRAIDGQLERTKLNG